MYILCDYLWVSFSGFGHYLAKRLDEQGFRVFAGCLERNGGGAAELKKSCSDRLRIVQLDVTKDDQIKNVRKCIEEVHRDTGCGKKSLYEGECYIVGKQKMA
jgi:NAD(P)-dependent dehydrogenase (short-subunit alcohol dehydrogenase family)